MTNTIVAIAGLTSRLAAFLIDHLLNKPNVHINGLCREPSKLCASIASNPRITVVKGDADDALALSQLVHQADIVICCYLAEARVMDDGQRKLIDACIAANVPRYMPADFCLDYRALQPGDLPTKDPMRRVMAYLEECKDKIQAVHVMNGSFMEIIWSLAAFWDAEELAFKFWGDGNDRWQQITYDDAAAYVAEVALDPSATGILRFAGDFASLAEIATTFETVYGWKPPFVCLGSLDDLYTEMHRLKTEEPDGSYKWITLFQIYYGLSHKCMLSPLDNSRYPHLQPSTVQDFLEDYEFAELSASLYF